MLGAIRAVDDLTRPREAEDRSHGRRHPQGSSMDCGPPALDQFGLGRKRFRQHASTLPRRREQRSPCESACARPDCRPWLPPPSRWPSSGSRQEALTTWARSRKLGSQRGRSRSTRRCTSNLARRRHRLAGTKRMPAWTTSMRERTSELGGGSFDIASRREAAHDRTCAAASSSRGLGR